MPMPYFYWNHEATFISIILFVWAIFFFRQMDIPLLLISLLLLSINWQFIFNIPRLVDFVIVRTEDSFLLVAGIVAGILGVIRSVKGLMVTLLKSDSVVDRWYRIVVGGVGKGNYVFG